MTVGEAVNAICASEYVQEDFVYELFAKGNNSLVWVLDYLMCMSQEEKDKYRNPSQRLCVKTGIDEEVCKQALIECHDNEELALKYLQIIGTGDVKREITYEMKSEVCHRTGMDLHDTEKYLLQTNGDVEEAIKIIQSLPSFKKEITYEMKSEVCRRTGMDLHDTEKYLLQTNGDVEEAIRIIQSLPSFKKGITFSMQREVCDRTKVTMREAEMFLTKTNGDVEEAVNQIESAFGGTQTSKSLNMAEKMKVVSTRTGMNIYETKQYLEQTNGDVEEAINIIKSLPSFTRRITVEMIQAVSKRTGMNIPDSKRYLEQTNGDVEAAINIIKSLPSFTKRITVEMIQAVCKRTGMNIPDSKRYLEQTNGDVEKAIELINGKDLAVNNGDNNGRKSQKELPTEPETDDNVIGFQDFVVKTDIYNCRKKGHDLKEITAIVFCMNAKGEVVEKNIMAGYCKTCMRYYILNREFERLRTNYRILCRVIDNSVVSERGTGVFSDFNQESVMKQYGYTVNQQDDLTVHQRQAILEFLIAAKILTKAEICSHIDWLINSRSYDKQKYRSAIKRWMADREFVANYRLTENRKVIVKRITKGKI